MKNLKLSALFLLALVVLSSSCEECFFIPKNQQSPDSVLIDSPAVLDWTGEYEVDGCGFMVIINDEEYKAKNEEVIDDSFKRNLELIEVILKYKLLGTQVEPPSGDLPPEMRRSYPEIEIISLQEK